jgi:formylglycine-generating enzyme required for sulfatase activity
MQLNILSRVFRGGGLYVSPQLCRVALRGYYSPDSRYNILGFRLTI